MAIKSTFSRPLASYTARKLNYEARNALKCQQKVFNMLISKAGKTVYGKDHGFREIRNYDDYRKTIPLTDYEGLRPYIERIAGGEKDVLWPGLPLYFATTSGTTSGSKYIPITRDSIHNHINTARNALLMYMANSGNYRFADHSMIFLQGSPELYNKGEIPAGRLSGITAHHIPAYLQKNRMPSWETNCIEDWETKVDRIVDETLLNRMSLISGIPSWLRMYFEKLVQKTGRRVGEIFPDFSVLVYGGLNFEPYRQTFGELIGRQIDTVELYPASEGFLAFQDRSREEGLLLNTNSGIFFEFIPMAEYHSPDPVRLSLGEVEVNKDYAIVLSNNAGLWAYNLGDTVRFVSTDPYRLVVSGRTSQFISAFGEHVIASEVEESLAEVCSGLSVKVDEFTVGPVINPSEGLPYHHWIIEFHSMPQDMEGLASGIDNAMCRRNPYYSDLIRGNVLQPLKITGVPRGTFRNFLESKGKLGGQNKVEHLSDNHQLADELLASFTQ